MNALDRTIVKVGTVALAVCAVGVLRAENPNAGKGVPVPFAVNLRRPPPCTPRDSMAPRTRTVAEMPVHRGGDDRIVPIPNPCRPEVSGGDAASAMRRLREDLARIQVLREAATRPAPR